MTRVGLSPALDSFLAGVGLAISEYRHELESDIEPFKALLFFSFVAEHGIVEPQWTARLAAVVAVSMAVTPLLIVLADRVLMPRFGTKPGEQRP